MKVVILEPAKIAELIGWPLDMWPGHCHDVASAMVEQGVVGGHAVYGHYVGPISAKSRWKRYRKLGFVRHGWIHTADSVIDPTRYVFENRAPYIFKDKLDRTGRHPEYDEGGNKLRRAMLQQCPSTNTNAARSSIEFSDNFTRDFVRDLVRTSNGDYSIDVHPMTDEQVFWLANLPLDMLGDFAPDVYAAVADAGCVAYIPIDNRRNVERVIGRELV